MAESPQRAIILRPGEGRSIDLGSFQMSVNATAEETRHAFSLLEISGRDYPRIQILTIRELLEERRKPALPLLLMPTYQQAERVPLAKAAEQKEMFG